jgi:biotin transport system substrate-specific component
MLDHSVAQLELRAPVRAAAVLLAVVLTALAAQFTIPLPFTAVPSTLTPLAVMLTGAALGSRLGFAAQALYLAAGAAGLPVFAPSALLPPGALRLIGPTGGYLLAYPVAAFVTGWLAERGWDRRYWTSFASMLVGLALIFAGGLSWYAISVTHSLSAAVAQGFMPFIVKDVFEAAAAALILPGAWKLLGSGAKS